jgi:hypothetical protein
MGVSRSNCGRRVVRGLYGAFDEEDFNGGEGVELIHEGVDLAVGGGGLLRHNGRGRA